MKKDETLIEKFERELKCRVELKTSPNTFPEKVLVDAFKYFDLTQTNKTNAKGFLQVIKQRIGISTLTDAQILAAFDFYANGLPEINYRETVNAIFQSQIAFSTANTLQKKDQTEFPQNRFDLNKHEDAIRKNIDFIIYKLRSSSVGAFFLLYFELWSSQSNQGDITSSSFHQALKRTGIDFSSDDIQKIFYYLANEKALLKLDRLVDFLFPVLKEDRLQLIRFAFTRFDYMLSQTVSLQLIKELFNPKNAMSIKEGRNTFEELSAQFEHMTNFFSKFNKNSFVINESQFHLFFRFLSNYFKDDREFSHFVEHCFRYSELPRTNTGKDISTRSPFDNKSTLIEDLSLKNSHVTDLTAILVQQLNAKGDRAYISFFKLLKCNDYDSDGKVFEREFEKTINESRLNFSKKQIQRLFEQFAADKQSLKINGFINLLVPEFVQEKADLVNDLFQKLSAIQNNSGQVSFDAIVNSFYAKLHPDFKKGIKADYEIKSEFEDSLKTFLSLYRGSHLLVAFEALLRFFEFYGRNWDFDYLESIVHTAFKVKTAPSRPDSTRPYGTTQDVENPPVDKSNRTQRGNPQTTGFKFYDEFAKQNDPKNRPYEPSNLLKHEEYKKTEEGFYNSDARPNLASHEEHTLKTVDLKIGYPYPVNEQKKEQNFSDEKSIAQFQPKAKMNFNKTPKKNEPIEDEPSLASQKARSLESQFNPNKREALESGQGHLVNSPEDGSVIPADTNFKYALDLNDRLASTSVRNYPPKISSFSHLQQKLAENIKSTGKMDLFLQLELEMTTQSDKQGYVDFEEFSSILESHNLLKNIKQQDLSNIYVSLLFDGQKLHVQKFANTIRGQASKQHEEICIDLYDRITPPDQELLTTQLIGAFIPQKFRIGIYKTPSEARDLLAKIVELFVFLNLDVKHKNTFELDDFLYMMDNFAFFIPSEDEFAKIMKACFK